MNAVRLELKESDRGHLTAAQRWLGLEAWGDARRELEAIAQEGQRDPSVMVAWWHLLAAEGEWSRAAEVGLKNCQAQPQVPHVWALLAFAVHMQGHTRAAREILLRVLPRFPHAYVIRWFLAIFASALGQPEEREVWVKEVKKLLREQRVKPDPEQEGALEAVWAPGKSAQMFRVKGLKH